MGETESVTSSLTIILLGVIGMLLLAVAIIVFFIVYQRRLFAQQDQIQALETAYQKDLLEASIKAQEVERQRIATDLHDGLGSLLSAIRLYVLQLGPNKSPQDYQELLNETKAIVDSAIAQTREISHNLHPSTLERFGVIQAIEDHSKRIQKLNGINVHFNYDKEHQFSQEQDLALYRIFQELINNTLKHAEATEIHISIKTDQPNIQLHYRDNGKGLPPIQVNEKRHGLGLKSIESRVNMLNGKMEITSPKVKGFQFEVSLPHSD